MRAEVDEQRRIGVERESVSVSGVRVWVVGKVARAVLVSREAREEWTERSVARSQDRRAVRGIS